MSEESQEVAGKQRESNEEAAASVRALARALGAVEEARCHGERYGAAPRRPRDALELDLHVDLAELD